jgi:hypothetical protein
MTEQEELEKLKKEEYYSPLLRGINVKDFLKKPPGNNMKISEIEIPEVQITKKAARDIVIPPVVIPKKTDATPGEPAAVLPPLDKPAGGGVAAGGDLPPLPGAGAGAGPLPGASVEPPPIEPPAKKSKGLSENDKDQILAAIQELREKLHDATDDVRFSLVKDQIMEEVKDYHSDLEKELKSLKDKKIPERKFFDTEGTYKEHLYSMTTGMLDEFLPQLFDNIPEYSFIATQVSRIFEDGTVADALITLIVRIISNGMKYDFKIDVPVLNGLMQYPLYMQRGQKIIPLTKSEVQKELETISYRKDDMNEDIPVKTNKNMFKNIDENPTRRPNHQKWYDVKPNTYKPVGLSPDHKFSPQRGFSR